MGKAARKSDLIEGGAHCHGMGHTHGPQPAPGRIIEGSSKVFIDGRPAARSGDRGYSPLCCAGIGEIKLLQSQQKVFIDGQPAAETGTQTIHCNMAPGVIKTGSSKVFINK